MERGFTAQRPNQLWVADITYVRIPTGFCYVAFITDVHSRKIVGWAVSSSLHTAGLPLLALEHALLSTGASRGHKGLIHHSDRGSQYVSLAYSEALITAGVSASVGTVGDSYDDAVHRGSRTTHQAAACGDRGPASRGGTCSRRARRTDRTLRPCSVSAA